MDSKVKACLMIIYTCIIKLLNVNNTLAISGIHKLLFSNKTKDLLMVTL